MAVWVVQNNVNCQQCNEQIKKIRGCYGLDKPVIIEGIEVWQCPMKEVKWESWVYLDIYHSYNNGVQFGNWLDQPIKVGEIIKIVSSVMEKNKNA